MEIYINISQLILLWFYVENILKLKSDCGRQMSNTENTNL